MKHCASWLCEMQAKRESRWCHLHHASPEKRIKRPVGTPAYIKGNGR